LGVLGAAVALVALAVGAIGPARGAARDKDKQTTFTVEALTTEQNFEGTALGDQIVLTTQLLKGDTEVGHQGGVCTVTSVQRNEAQCVATYSFRGGQITAQALIILGDPAPYARPSPAARASTRASRVRYGSTPPQKRNRGGS
jgi:hypothetical protein